MALAAALPKALIAERTDGRSGSARSSTTTGSAPAPARIAGRDGRDFLERLDPPADAREGVIVALFMVSTLDRQIHSSAAGSAPRAPRPTAKRR